MKKEKQSPSGLKEKTITFTRHASIDEHMKMQDRLLSEMEALETLEEEKKDAAKKYKEMIDSKVALIKVLRQDLKEHKITLTQECRIIKDYSRGEWIFVDPVTGEQVHSEKFSETDWQMVVEEETFYEVVGQPLQLSGTSPKLLAAGDDTFDECEEVEE